MLKSYFQTDPKPRENGWEEHVCGVQPAGALLLHPPGILAAPAQVHHHSHTGWPRTLVRCFIPYVQEVVTLQKKCLIYLHQKMMFTPVINYYNTLG